MFLKRIIKDFLALMSYLKPAKKGVAVLLYHSIGQNKVFFTIRPAVFARQMEYLKDKQYQVISLSNLIKLLGIGQDLPAKTVVLTFDDGFQDNYLEVWPILKKYHFPATVFLTVSSIGKTLNNSQKIPLPALKWPQIEEMRQSGLIDFQPHGLTHQKLDKVALRKAEQEISESKRIIQEKLNKTCQFFAYPKGRYDQSIIEILKKHGFWAGLTIEPGFVKKGDDRFILKRNSIHSATSFIQFKAKI